uniref:Uncharacterized protein n=1 Tax=Salarias fasciatus TaxID=181472 RepID=A0A672IYJ3_SALFA
MCSAAVQHSSPSAKHTHLLMSPAERAVATVKGLWKGKGDKAAALQTYRATPLESGYSPAQLLMWRQIRSGIPQVPAVLRPRWPNIGRHGAKNPTNIYSRKNVKSSIISTPGS